MPSKVSLCPTGAALALVAIAAASCLLAEEPRPTDILKWGDADQIAWIRAHLDRGIPTSDAFSTLRLSKSSLVLPLIEKKIEEVIQSASPAECFTDKSVDPQRFVGYAASLIANTGDEIALRIASRLMRVDERRFEKLVWYTLVSAEGHGPRNPFTLAYRGFEIGDPAVDKRIVAWAEDELTNFKVDSRFQHLRDYWAEALVEKYGGVPAEVDWTHDPLVRRLRPALAETWHQDVMRRTWQVADERKNAAETRK